MLAQICTCLPSIDVEEANKVDLSKIIYWNQKFQWGFANHRGAMAPTNPSATPLLSVKTPKHMKKISITS
jgi:hypothetical protein